MKDNSSALSTSMSVDLILHAVGPDDLAKFPHHGDPGVLLTRQRHQRGDRGPLPTATARNHPEPYNVRGMTVRWQSAGGEAASQVGRDGRATPSRDGPPRTPAPPRAWLGAGVRQRRVCLSRR
jgi:hypothetical protein